VEFLSELFAIKGRSMNMIKVNKKTKKALALKFEYGK